MIVAIVQARMGSSRLPGKVMMDLGGQPVLAWVLARVEAIPGIERVCCAVPDGLANWPLARRASDLGAIVTRGPEADVLERYLIAARATKADAVMRITCDCPFLDPKVSGLVLCDFLAGGADYVSNVDPRSWPRGLDTEVFSRAALERAGENAVEASSREHVTTWMRHASHVVRRNVALSDNHYDSWRWTLDFPEDLSFMKAVLEHLPPFPQLTGFDEIRAVVEKHPEIAALNAHLA